MADGIAVKGEFQLGCDVPCGDDGQARGLVPMQIMRWWRISGGLASRTRGLRVESWTVHMVRDQSKST